MCSMNCITCNKSAWRCSTAVKSCPDYNFRSFSAIQRRFISVMMITQLAAYGSFVSDLRVAYNKRELEPFSHITRQVEVIYFSDWQR
ncbi:conserved hypothetical protein [Klebsiella variicola]|nr:conserved hypothetical protein [Klebsiella variicola]